MRNTRWFVLCCVLLTACSSGKRQGSTVISLLESGGSPSRIEGQVTDEDGHLLPAVSVSLTGSTLSRNTRTDSGGRYSFARIPPGSYELKVSLPGFDSEGVSLSLKETHSIGLRTALRSSAREAVTATLASSPASVPARVDEIASLKTDEKAARLQALRGGVITANVVPSLPPLETPVQAQYASISDHEFVAAKQEATTTFAIDVDRASYANIRRFLTAGQAPPRDAVRIEEMINYFSYSYPQPSGPHPFSVTTEVASCPWQPGHRLLRVGIQGRNLEAWRMAPNNLVFLIDVSGSMQPPARLPLLKSAFRLLVETLRAEDRVAIVVYAGAAGLVLPSTSGADKETILAALDRLNSGGSTAGAEGIQLAYQVAKQHFLREGNNRVILATDGDFNVGPTAHDDLLALIEENRAAGIFLTTLGVGDDNYQDARMEMLADHGNGNYAYLDNLSEAEKVFVRELTGTLVTIAKDVKVQLEFNPALVLSYRQIGYENRSLRNEDFADDGKDAGELGAGHSVTALYEIVPASQQGGPIAALRLRYQQPSGSKSELLSQPVVDQGRNIHEASADLQFAAAVAEFGMLLRRSAEAGSASFAEVLALGRQSRGPDLDGLREEFLRLAESGRALVGREGPAVARN